MRDIGNCFATAHVVVLKHCNEKFCFQNILYFICKWTSKSSTARVHHYSRYFPAYGTTNPGIIPQNFSSLGFVVSEELGNIQTYSFTDRLVLWYKLHNLGFLSNLVHNFIFPLPKSYRKYLKKFEYFHSRVKETCPSSG